jgi:hypothetical protein
VDAVNSSVVGYRGEIGGTAGLGGTKSRGVTLFSPKDKGTPFSAWDKENMHIKSIFGYFWFKEELEIAQTSQQVVSDHFELIFGTPNIFFSPFFAIFTIFVEFCLILLLYKRIFKKFRGG